MNNFKGFIPPMIHLKSSLFPTIVNLARNKLQGPIHTQLENVNVIDLTLKNFVGSIPSKIGEAPGIRSISLSGNKILGSLPESFCHASNVLQVLDLSNNSFSVLDDAGYKNFLYTKHEHVVSLRDAYFGDDDGLWVDARRRHLSVRAHRWKSCLPTCEFDTLLCDLAYLTLCHSQIGTMVHEYQTDRDVLGLYGSGYSSRPVHRFGS
ncbi:hypothetical protein CQW23_13384 [Capsicum baccatum]|uniref:Uncharacterized protein n=1 Tax=Capsicum baccatum TaxID=33114 RepID=A0A2G2WV93_CAPBA|nr:hypothetical protein CQW23_13384 [Capsicum baccatum]